MTGEEFRARVFAVHEKHTGSITSHGALTWYGKQLGVRGRSGRAVYTWTTMERVPDGPHLVVLALLELLEPQLSHYDVLLLAAMREKLDAMDVGKK